MSILDVAVDGIGKLRKLVPEFLKPKWTGKAIDVTSGFIGKYLGCAFALTAFNLAVDATGSDPAKDFASTHMLGFLSANAPVPKAISSFLVTSGLAPYAPAIAAAIGAVAILGAYRMYTGYRGYKADQFAERKAAVEQEIRDVCLEEGFGPSKKLNKLVQAYEKHFKPDFSPQQTQAIRDSLAVQRSELKIFDSVSPSQQESLKKISDTLTKLYSVPSHLAMNAGMNILVEMDGNTHAVMAKLKSHNIEEDWINKFKLNPDATIVGIQKKIKREEQTELSA